MSVVVAGLVGREVGGAIGFSPRSLAVAFATKPRSYLWIHLERKEATYATAEEFPLAPDPRGSRFGALEDLLRGLRVLGVSAEEDTLTLALSREGETVTHVLRLGPDRGRVNLVLRTEPEGRALWAFHRELPHEGRTPGPEFTPPRARAAESPDARERLRRLIADTFEEDFRREIDRITNAAGRVLTRRLAAQGGDLERAREQKSARRRGEVLLAHYKEIARGASRVRLPDPFADSPGGTVEIDLDPSLTPHENAARLFQLAKKGERGEKLVETRLHQTRHHLARLEALRREIPDLQPREALRRLSDFLDAADLGSLTRGDVRGTRLGRRTAGPPRAVRPGHRSPGARESIRPRTFVTSDGWEVWVGRNNTDNDLITHRLSNPHDYWFHVVGVPGSHVILRRPTRNAIPKPRTLEEAAAIAAYFSKARKQTRVPVIYTERKFVSKPRRGKPGQAICSREKELLVRPRIPETNAGKNGREVSG